MGDFRSANTGAAPKNSSPSRRRQSRRRRRRRRHRWRQWRHGRRAASGPTLVSSLSGELCAAVAGGVASGAGEPIVKERAGVAVNFGGRRGGDDGKIEMFGLTNQDMRGFKSGRPKKRALFYFTPPPPPPLPSSPSSSLNASAQNSCARQLSRQQLSTELSCPLRDLRVADPTFPGQFPSVLARCGAIIFSVADVKARPSNNITASV